MDLLDHLDHSPVKVKTFGKTIDISAAIDAFEDNDTQDINDGYSSGPFHTDLNTEETEATSPIIHDPKALAEPTSAADDDDVDNLVSGPPPVGVSLGFNNLLISRIHRRLNNEPEDGIIDNKTQEITETEKYKEDEETQPVLSQNFGTGTHDVETQVIESNIAYSELETQKITYETQSNQVDTQVITTQRVTDKSILTTDAETQVETQVETETQLIINNDDTQLVPSQLKSTSVDAIQQNSEEGPLDVKPHISNLFMDDSDEDSEEEQVTDNLIKDTATEEETQITEEQMKLERQKKIEALAEKKRAQRLFEEQSLKKKEEKDLDGKPQVDEDQESDDQEAAENIIEDGAIEMEAYTVKNFNNNTLFAAFSAPKPAQPQVADENRDVNFLSNFQKSKTTIEPQPKAETKVAPETFRFKLKNDPQDGRENITLDDSDSDDDEMFQYSKSAVLEVKTRFSKRKAEKKDVKKNGPAFLSKGQLFAQLMNANKKQIQEEKRLNPELYKENKVIEQETLDVQALLQRHIEHNNKIREQEEAEARREQGLDEEFDQDYEVPDSDVPDSDVPDSDIEGDDDEVEDDEKEEHDDGDDEQAENQIVNHKGESKFKKRNRKMVVKDNDDSDKEDNAEEDVQDEFDRIPMSQINKDNNINLGDFGGNLTQSFDPNDSQSSNIKSVSLTQIFEKGSQVRSSQSQKPPPFDLFAKMKNKANKVIDNASFYDTSSFEGSMSLNAENSKDNEDEESQQYGKDASTHGDLLLEATSKDIADSDDDIEVTRSKPKRLVKRRDDSSDDDDGDEEEDTEEQRQERLKQVEKMKQERRAYESKMKQRKKEMKAKGLDKMMEAEAEESEDEWHGIGGADGERSDDENSEDEKMLDDVSKIKVNKAAIEAKIREETNAEERALLEKILKDLETGKLGKRGKDSDFDIDVDDGEDEVMRSYRIYNQLKKREQLEQDSALRKLAQDKRSKAFFETITEELRDSNDDVLGFPEDLDEDSNEEDGESNPFEIKKKDFKDPSTITKKKKVTVAFVQKTLSFISNPDDHDDFTSGRRYDDNGEEDDSFTDDLRTLKQNSIIKIPDKTPQRKRSSTIDLTAENDLSPSNLFRMPSIVSRSSFQTLEKENTDMVTVSTGSKVSSSSRTSVMSIGKRTIDSKKSSIREQRVLKVRKIAAQFGSQSNNRLKRLNSNNGFD